MPDTIGVIGLGRMGGPMARNFLDEAYDGHVFDVRDEAIEDLEAAGAIGESNPAAVASECDVVFVVVQNEAQTRDVIDMAERQGITMPSAGLLRERVRELQAEWVGA